jgi:hypothetical protein
MWKLWISTVWLLTLMACNKSKTEQFYFDIEQTSFLNQLIQKKSFENVSKIFQQSDTLINTLICEYTTQLLKMQIKMRFDFECNQVSAVRLIIPCQTFPADSVIILMREFFRENSTNFIEKSPSLFQFTSNKTNIQCEISGDLDNVHFLCENVNE